MDDLLADFLTETNESLAELDTALIRLEQVPDDQATLSQIFRLVHTIKGTCGFLGLPRLEKVAHAGENVLGRFRDGTLTPTPAAITVILKAIDRIKMIVAGLEATEGEPAGDDDALIGALNALMEGEAAEPEPTPDPGPVAAVQPPVEPAALAVPAPAAEQPEQVAAPGESGVAAQTIRVSVDVLEDLMTLVSELVLARNQLLQLGRTQQNSPFTVPLQRLSHITTDLQEGVMKTRMQPIGNAWNKLPRLVRDLARETGKRIELAMHGAETELDRQVLEFIKDPLTHMVRNSADHGLETTTDRRAAGKPETGRISLNAFHEGGHIIIEIADDGRGLNTRRIAEKAVAQGFATEAELAQLSETAIHQFIFRAGFSTAAQITAVSGRGVGMDVVKTNIEKIGGTIELRSREGRGTTVTIKIPLTLAIVSALIVECARERFAIPQISVVELVRTGGGSETTIEQINRTPVLRLRDRLLPLVRLSSLLALDEGEPDERAESFIVVAKVGTENFGLIVDRVFDTEEIVVKPVAPILRDITLFSGNTILGDGSVIMILDPNGIARTVGIGAAAGAERTGLVEPTRTDAGSSGARTSLLLFRAGGAEPKAVPLGLVARLEEIAADRIERAGARAMVQYRGRLMPLVPMGVDLDDATVARRPVLVFSDGGRSMGLVVDEILDVVEDVVTIQLGSARPGILGSAVIAGRATEIIDTGHWLALAAEDWFAARRGGAGGPRPHLLVIDDSAFFRHMLVPVLTAAGYEVTAAETADAALRLREQGRRFDAIVSDIEMPGMDGFAFARAVREDPRWAALPLVALTGRVADADILRGRESGFTDYVAKFDREALLAGIAQVLATRRETEAA
ncbi:hybrid sensor histidine kinase/response regulator [Elioraea sp.]|uniref:hybrid sensor histidine kinase/response regulator n=1 Tax=Elioraea sp. TaxID=2185103 RepID=UPI003F7291BF